MSLPGDQPNPWSREGQGTPYYSPPPPSSTPPPYAPPPYSPPPPRRRPGPLWVGLGVLMAVVVGAALWGAIAEIRSTDLSSESASGSSADLSGPNKVVTANDGKSQVTVPASWKDVPAAVQNELAAIQVGNLPRGQYIAVITGDKGDFDGFDGFSSACVEEARILFEDAEIGERRDLTIGGLPAVKYEITGKANGIRLVYWYAMVEGENAYYQVIGWTMPSRQAESEPVITEVINSFRELGAT